MRTPYEHICIQKKFVFFLPVPRDAILCPCSDCNRSVLMVWRSASVGGVRVKQPIGRALSMGLSESEDGSAATGQMVMRSFTSFLFYVRPHKKKKVSLRVPYVLHCMYIDVNCVVFGPFELGPTITYPLCLNYPPRAHLMV